MKQTIEIKVPNNWSAITLKQYLALKRDMDGYEGEPEAILACMFHHLCKLPLEYVTSLDIKTYKAIANDMERFLHNVESPLQRFITIDGIEYGFEPNLSQMAYGAYVDIAKYDEMTINEKWADIMSILYRPVSKKSLGKYDIEKYTGHIDGSKFLDVTMDIHFGALFFFINLSRDLQSSILKSLTQTSKQIHPSIKSILEKSGNLTRHLSNSPTEIYSKWMKLQNNL